LEKEWTTTIGKTIGAYKEVIMLGQALWVVAMVLKSKYYYKNNGPPLTEGS
jgi:hypothetical protein